MSNPGPGTVYTETVVHLAPERFAGEVPYQVVIVDLDGVLWPGVLAETGSPFAWDPAISGVFSYIGLFIGNHTDFEGGGYFRGEANL